MRCSPLRGLSKQLGHYIRQRDLDEEVSATALALSGGLQYVQNRQLTELEIADVENYHAEMNTAKRRLLLNHISVILSAAHCLNDSLIQTITTSPPKGQIYGAKCVIA